MFIGNSYIIPAISNLPGQHPRGDLGFAFNFKTGEDSWFQSSTNVIGNSPNPGISCWIKIDSDFFVDPAPGSPTETQHILDKYGFGPGGVASGYRLILEKGINNSGSIFRRLVWQIGYGDGGQSRAVINVNSLSGNTVYLVTASAAQQSQPTQIVLFLRGANNVSLNATASLTEEVDIPSVPFVVGNANPISTAAEFGGDVDEVAIWNGVGMTEVITNEIFNWPTGKDLNNLQNIVPPICWWQMGENGSINSQGNWELPSQVAGGASTILRSTGNVTRISPGLPNQLYN